MVLGKFAIIAGLFAGFAAAQTLDFEVYRSKVEPIFMKKRGAHARCVSCHSASNSRFKLEELPQGATGWSEEQSRKNFDSVSKLVVPGDPLKSRLLKHPLAQDAGGDLFHNGGRQFTSQTDPDWQIIAEWVKNGH
ncbi:MAG TPA: hypothetical protein VLY24_24460 [Bryobacteraceae bacterium]|nr:hypothetical protein [Bryobacteraceae bacterium]